MNRSVNWGLFACVILVVAITAGCGGGGSGASVDATPAAADAVAGTALYESKCAGCHGPLASSSKKGVTAARLQNAINGNVGGMGSLSTLSTSDIQALVTALSPAAATPAPTPTSNGTTLYAANCAGCHGALASSSKKGITVARLQSAIANNTGGMGTLSTLSASDVQALVTALTPATPAPTPTPTPVVDGATLYSSYCASCHGALASSAKTGATASRIQTAINNNTGSMGSLSVLSSAQVAAIGTALTAATPAPTPTPVTDGAVLYASSCAGCHGALASSAKAGATASRIQTAINNNTGSMGSLSTLSATQVAAIGTALATATPSPTPAPACGSCHAIPPALGHHSTHLSEGVSCGTCHGTGYSSTTVNAATHNNGVKNVDVAATGWNVTKRTCSNSCHGTKTW